MTRTSPDYDAIVICAGFSGIRMVWELQRLGLTARCFDAGSDIGGTWWWNRYPGCRTDGEAWVYALRFLPELLEEWDFTERYPSQEEIQWYLIHVIDRYDLRKDIEFNAVVEAAHYSDSNKLWSIRTTNGSVATSRYFPPRHRHYVYSQGADVPWAAVVQRGGSSGIQVITKLAPIVEKLTVFQRTPNYVIPAQNYPLDKQKREDVKKNVGMTWDIAKVNLAGHAVKHSGRTVASVCDPEEIRRVFEDGWARGCYNFQLGTFDDSFMNPDANAATANFIRDKIRSIVRKPETAEALYSG
ncbi:hypothetical protein BDW67DRAFT_188530 [Aspergillus spinulosporus]